MNPVDWSNSGPLASLRLSEGFFPEKLGVESLIQISPPHSPLASFVVVDGADGRVQQIARAVLPAHPVRSGEKRGSQLPSVPVDRLPVPGPFSTTKGEESPDPLGWSVVDADTPVPHIAREPIMPKGRSLREEALLPVSFESYAPVLHEIGRTRTPDVAKLLSVLLQMSRAHVKFKRDGKAPFRNLYLVLNKLIRADKAALESWMESARSSLVASANDEPFWLQAARAIGEASGKCVEQILAGLAHASPDVQSEFWDCRDALLFDVPTRD